jgi:NADH:ubiquinone oxidoreductase subunit E
LEEQSRIEKVREILGSYPSGAGQLVPVLLDIQEQIGYLPAEGMSHVADSLGIGIGDVYAVASFYSQFQLTPVGRHRIRVCRGTSCHIRGAPRILAELEKDVGIAEGETSADLEYTLETVACIGCCALAPCIKVNDDVHGELDTERVHDVALSLKKGSANGG